MSGGSSFWDNPFGGLFDWNGDGKEDWLEQWDAYNLINELTKFSELTKRQSYEDGLEFGIDPEDYETEEDYDEALEEAKYGWRDTAEDGLAFGIYPEDYETEEDYDEALKKAKYGWRDRAKDGLALGIYPEAYETEEEYNRALKKAKYGWRDTAKGGLALGVDPENYETEEEYRAALVNACFRGLSVSIPISITVEADTDEEDAAVKESDYPNKRQYEAAATLAERYVFYADEGYEKEKKDRCRFILEQNDKILAANYLTADGDFLFSQAVKDHFDLPVTLPDEDEKSKFPLLDILKKIQKKDVPLAMNVLEWCVEQFLPFVDYSAFERGTLTNDLLDGMYYGFSDSFRKAFRQYLNDHADFGTKLIREAAELPGDLSQLIDDMIRDGYTGAAKSLFDEGLSRANGEWKKVNQFMEELIAYAEDGEELETMEFVEQNFLPEMRRFSDGMILDEMEGWRQTITEYKRDVERQSEKYAFSRSNVWRNTVPDGSGYGLDPRDFDTEQEYLDALQKEKYAWRKRAAAQDTLGLDPEQFETEEEYDEAWQARYDKERQARFEEQRARYEEQQTRRREEQEKQRQLLQRRKAEIQERRRNLEAELLKDQTIYTYCGVKFPFAERPYFFRTDDGSLKIGDTVLVPLGEGNREVEGTVVSVGQYSRIAVPFPVEKTKFILRKIG